MQKNFELTFLIKGALASEESNKIFADAKELIKDSDGVITNEKVWGSRKLAYMIAKQEQAFYYTVNFDLDTLKINKLEKSFQLNNNIIRHLIIVSYKKAGVIDFEAEKQRARKVKEDKEVAKPVDTKEQEKKLAEALEKILEE